MLTFPFADSETALRRGAMRTPRHRSGRTRAVKLEQAGTCTRERRRGSRLSWLGEFGEHSGTYRLVVCPAEHWATQALHYSLLLGAK